MQCVFIRRDVLVPALQMPPRAGNGGGGRPTATRVRGGCMLASSSTQSRSAGELSMPVSRWCRVTHTTTEEGLQSIRFLGPFPCQVFVITAIPVLLGPRRPTPTKLNKHTHTHTHTPHTHTTHRQTAHSSSSSHFDMCHKLACTALEMSFLTASVGMLALGGVLFLGTPTVYRKQKSSRSSPSQYIG